MWSTFWGIFLVSSGLFLVLKYSFNWNVSTGKVLIGLLLISWGLSALLGRAGFSSFPDNGGNYLFRNSGLTKSLSCRWGGFDIYL